MKKMKPFVSLVLLLILCNLSNAKAQVFSSEELHQRTLHRREVEAAIWGTVYDNITRSMVQNAANKAALSSMDNLKTSTDGSIDLYFGPQAPSGLESNWVDTRPSKGFFVWFRAYSPTAAFFDKSWSLPDIEKIQ